METSQWNPPEQRASNKAESAARNTLKVFCRIKPIENGKYCVKARSSTTVSLLPSEGGSSYHLENYKEIHHTFRYVFDDKSTQKEVFDRVALPIVENLVHGKNGLIFAYGVTGSGKTYTMTGKPQDGGIVPRCLDVIFNSISSYQAMKYIFTPDGMNGFHMQSDTDAITALQSTQRIKESFTELSEKIPDSTKIESVKENNIYAVFITYVEIYNNGVYDLLEDVPKDPTRPNQLAQKNIREDSYHNMYVHLVTEVEVKSSEEAYEAFCKGEKRRRMATTTLNSESSRSHSIFTIKLVQAPLHGQGGICLLNRRPVCISQLSLVDLAGSERSKRTHNSGDRLRETGKINNSLMTLRKCLEIMRENQLHGANKVVPYRESKMTLLFKRFFEGEGQVEMIVCLNPGIEDHAETIQVLRFSEMTQEVQVDFALPVLRRKDNIFLKGALQKVEEICNTESGIISSDIDHNWSMNYKCQEALIKYWQTLYQDFCDNITDLQKSCLLFDQRFNSLQTALQEGTKKMNAVGNRIDRHDLEIMKLRHQVNEHLKFLQ
jgi:kinesin family protein 23